MWGGGKSTPTWSPHPTPTLNKKSSPLVHPVKRLLLSHIVSNNSNLEDTVKRLSLTQGTRLGMEEHTNLRDRINVHFVKRLTQ